MQELEIKLFRCYECKELIEPKDLMGHNSHERTGMGWHRQCHNLRNAIWAQEKRAKENPERYVSCNGCDRTFSKYFNGAGFTRGHNGRNAKTKEVCPYCGSKDFEPY